MGIKEQAKIIYGGDDTCGSLLYHCEDSECCKGYECKNTYNIGYRCFPKNGQHKLQQLVPAVKASCGKMSADCKNSPCCDGFKCINMFVAHKCFQSSSMFAAKINNILYN